MELEPIVQKIGSQYDPVGIMAFIADLGVVSIAAVAAAASIALIAGATVEAVKATMDWGTSLHDIQEVLGDTTDHAAGLKLAADATGVSTELITQKMILLAKGLESAGGQMGNSAKELDNLHIAFRNADGTFMDSTTLLQSIADHFGTMADGTEKNNELATIFGRNVAGLNDLMKQMAGEGMQKYIDQAKAMGLALSPAQVENIHNLNMNMNVLKDQFTGIAVILGSAFIPAIQAIVKWIGDLVTSLTPAIAQFGQFLGILLGVKGAIGSSDSSAKGSVIDPAYKYLGTVSGPGSPAVYSDPTTGGVTQNPPTTGGGGEHEGRLGTFQPSSDFKMTDFETAITTFVNGIKAIDWKAVATGFDKGAVAITTVVNEVIKLFPSLAVGATGDAAIGMHVATMGTAQNAAITQPTLTAIQVIGDFFKDPNKFNRDMALTMSNIFSPIVQAGIDSQTTISKNTITTLNGLDATNRTLNTSIIKLPGLIGAAIAANK